MKMMYKHSARVARTQLCTPRLGPRASRRDGIYGDIETKERVAERGEISPTGAGNPVTRRARFLRFLPALIS